MFQAEVNKLVGSQFCDNVSPATMRIKLERAGEVAELCERQIKKARKEKGGKLTIKKRGVIIDENGHRVEAFAFEIGRFMVSETLYTGIAVDMLTEDVHVLLIRSDVKKGAYELFPDIGTAQDWRILRKCADRFSPKSASHRYTINPQVAHYLALETAAVKCLKQSGTFQQCDLAAFQEMDTAKLHLIDLGAVIALENAFPRHLLPRMVNVILVRNADDLEEVHRVFKALDFAAGAQAPGLYVPAVCMHGKNSLDIWRKSSRFAYLTYEKSQDVDCLFTAVSQTLALNDTQFHEHFPHIPVVVGSSIWSGRACTEIDMRGLRFTDEELLVGRKYLATLLKNHALLMSEFSEIWAQSIGTQAAAITSYPQLWFQAFHFAIGKTIFPASNALLDYLELTRSADAGRLRLRVDREKRYATAIGKLKEANGETAWVHPVKPQTKADALALLEGEYDAFLHQKDGRPVLAFTEASLIRCAGLEQSEVDDFVSKLKQNHMLTNKTYPVTFANREQHRFICVSAPSLTVTGGEKEGSVA